MAKALAFALCAALLVPPSSALADPSRQAAPGIRVRLTAPDLYDEPLVGTLTALEQDAFSLRPEGRLEPIRVPRAAVTKWEVSQGRQSHTGKGALWGFAAGAAVGAVGVGSMYDYSGSSIALGGLFYGAAGAGLGALIGSALKTERWEELEERALRIGVVPVPDGIGFSIEWSFGGGASRSRRGEKAAAARPRRPRVP